MQGKTKHDTKFFERYARISLIDLVDGRFTELENKECPDLQNKEQTIGIEVTRAIEENKNVANALINEIAGRAVLKVSEEDWHDMKKYGYGYGINESLIGSKEYNYWAQALPMKRIIENKINKVVNGYYGNFPFYGIYIFVKENLSDIFVDGTINYAMNLQQHKEHKYSYMYISQIQDLFVCNLENATFEKIGISKNKRRKFYNEAIK